MYLQPYKRSSNRIPNNEYHTSRANIHNTSYDDQKTARTTRDHSVGSVTIRPCKTRVVRPYQPEYKQSDNPYLSQNAHKYSYSQSRTEIKPNGIQYKLNYEPKYSNPNSYSRVLKSEYGDSFLSKDGVSHTRNSDRGMTRLIIGGKRQDDDIEHIWLNDKNFKRGDSNDMTFGL